MARDWDEEDATSYELEGLEICNCGCTRSEHRMAGAGACMFCGECDGFELDHDATVMAFTREDYP